MDKADQSDPASVEAETFSQGFLRNVQGYDFESGLCVFNGMHALAGFLPVVPGPCGLFRCSALTDAIVGRVRAICSSAPERDSLVQGNLKIAEDRILSYLLLLTERHAWQTHWVPTTTFFFESEDTLRELVLQRRRWLNGTTAGYLWLVSQPELWRGVRSLRWMSVKVLALALLQLLVFAITYVMPGLLIVTGSLALSGLLLALEVVGLDGAFNAFVGMQTVYLCIALGSFCTHVGLARLSQRNYVEAVWKVRVVLNASTMIANALALAFLVALAATRPDLLTAVIGERNLEDLLVASAFGALFATTPFFLSYMHSRASFRTIIATFPAYFAFMPTILADFNAYSVARFDDLSWGTKATALGSAKGKAAVAPGRNAAHARALAARKSQQEAALTSAAEQRARQRAQREEARRNAAQREQHWASTNALSVVQVLLSLSIAVVNAELNSRIAHYLLYVGFATAAAGLFVQVCSFSYFVPRALCGRGAGSVSERLFALFNALCWAVSLAAVVFLFLIEDRTSSLWQSSAFAFCGAFVAAMLAASLRFSNPESDGAGVYGGGGGDGDGGHGGASGGKGAATRPDLGRLSNESDSDDDET
jgi:chitin synthase